MWVYLRYPIWEFSFVEDHCTLYLLSIGPYDLGPNVFRSGRIKNATYAHLHTSNILFYTKRK